MTTDNKMKLMTGVYSPGKKSSVYDTPSYDSPSPSSPVRMGNGIPKLNLNLINQEIDKTDLVNKMKTRKTKMRVKSMRKQKEPINPNQDLEDHPRVNIKIQTGEQKINQKLIQKVNINKDYETRTLESVV